jgi:SHS2 domain-containing protein
MYRWVDHTAEVELEIDAAGEAEVFADALGALAELLGCGGDRPTDARTLALSEPDRALLLAAWLEELTYLGESQGFVAVAIDELVLSPDGLHARVRGAIDEPPPLVKAVTLHRLLFEPGGSGYVARVVLDV